MLGDSVIDTICSSTVKYDVSDAVDIGTRMRGVNIKIMVGGAIWDSKHSIREHIKNDR